MLHTPVVVTAGSAAAAVGGSNIHLPASSISSYPGTTYQCDASSVKDEWVCIECLGMPLDYYCHLTHGDNGTCWFSFGW
jgi:hypothetical protein